MTHTHTIDPSGRVQGARLTLGMLIPQLTDTFDFALWSGVADAAQEHDASLICFAGRTLHPPSEDEAAANAIYDLVAPKTVDGLIVVSGALSYYSGLDVLQAFCDRLHLPVVSTELALDGAFNVLIDNAQGTRDAVAHLIEHHGCRRIAFVRGPENQAEAEDRYRAYRETLERYGLPFDPGLVAPGHFFPSDGVDAVALWLDQRAVRFDAVVAANDPMAMGATAALQNRGIRVPYDVAVVGFDDLDEVSYTVPPLTSVRQPRYTQGRRAAEILLAHLRGEEVPAEVILPSELVVRQSCGCLAPVVVEAALDWDAGPGESRRAVPVAGREHACRALSEAAGPSPAGLDAGWEARVLDVFSGALHEGDPRAFLTFWDTLLRRPISLDNGAERWHAVLSALRGQVLPALSQDALRLRAAEDLLQQARVALSEMVRCAQARRQLETEGRSQLLAEIGQTLITTFDVTDLMSALAGELPRLDIRGCYVSTYEGTLPSEWSRLLLAYHAERGSDVPAGGRRFPSRCLVPEGVLPAHRASTLLVLPLHFRSEQLGFVLFEIGPRDRLVYELLRGQLSSALKGALLVQQQERVRQELESTRQELETALREAVEVQRRYVHQEWQAYVASAADSPGYACTQDGTELPVPAWLPAMEAALQSGSSAVQQGGEGEGVSLGIPLQLHDEIVGVLGFDRREGTPWNSDEVAVAEAIVEQVALALESARLLEQTQTTLARTEVLYRAARSAAFLENLSSVLQTIVDGIARALPADRVALITMDQEARRVVDFLRGGPGVGWVVDTVAFDELWGGLSGWVLREHKPAVSPRDVSDPRESPEARRRRAETNCGSIVVLPLLYRDQIFGTLTAINRPDQPDFTEQDVELMMAVASQAAAAIQNARMLEQTQTRARREQILREITTSVRGYTEPDAILRAAVRRLGSALGRPAFVRLGSAEDLSQAPKPSGNGGSDAGIAPSGGK